MLTEGGVTRTRQTMRPTVPPCALPRRDRTSRHVCPTAGPHSPALTLRRRGGGGLQAASGRLLRKYEGDRSAQPLRLLIKTKGHFPNEDASRKLIYLAVTNAVPACTRTRDWTAALPAFKIEFGDRLPDQQPRRRQRNGQPPPCKRTLRSHGSPRSTASPGALPPEGAPGRRQQRTGRIPSAASRTPPGGSRPRPACRYCFGSRSDRC
jgi:hypothetical protein